MNKLKNVDPEEINLTDPMAMPVEKKKLRTLGDIVELQKDWDVILDGIKSKCTPKIHAILKDGQITAINDMDLVVEFDPKNAFHKRELIDPDTQKKYELAISEVMGKPMRLIAKFGEPVEKPTTTRGKTMEAIAIKTEDERNKAITEVKEIANTLAMDIEALKAQKAEKDAVMQRLDSDLREMGILSARKKEVVKARLALLKAESESIQEDIKIKADEWRKADCAFFQLTKVSAIDDTIQELRSEMDNIQTLITTLQDNQSSLKQMIVKQVISK